MAFKPLCAVAQDGQIPLAEIREAMVAKVEGVLFYGAMFLFLAPNAATRLNALQEQFEKALISAPPWFSPTRTRAIGGWALTWGEKLTYCALAFRAELWCCSSHLLVRSAWEAAQSFPGRTFASLSAAALSNLEIGEVYDSPGWASFLDDASPILSEYCRKLKSELQQRSTANWRAALAQSCGGTAHLMMQLYPCSAGKRLFDAGFLACLCAADRWERLRHGLLGPLTSNDPTLGIQVCIICGCASSGIGHLLGQCLGFADQQSAFRRQVDAHWCSSLSLALPADWAVTLFSPHLDLMRLQEAVQYSALVADAVSTHWSKTKQKQKHTLAEKTWSFSFLLRGCLCCVCSLAVRSEDSLEGQLTSM